MRRVPRIRRPSGAASAATKQPIAPFTCQRAAAAATFTQTSTTAPRTTAAATTTTRAQSIPSIPFSRLYSTQTESNNATKQPPHIPQSLTTGRDLELLAAAEDPTPAPYVAPPRRTEALRSDEVSDTHYAPATTSEGLETVGGIEGWWESREHWRRDFEGFKPRRKVQHPVVLEATARRAVIEALALKHAGKDAELISVWPPATPGDVVNIKGTLTVDLRVDANGSVELNGNVTGVLRSLDWELAGQEANVADTEAETPVETGKIIDLAKPSRKPRSAFSPQDIEELRDTWDKSWKLVPLVDPRLKFAITKRIFQLTGHLTPDHRLSEITNVQALLRVLQKPPKPRTLTEEILMRDLKFREQQQQQQQQEGQEEGETQQAEGQGQRQQEQPELTQLPNVTFVPRRVTRGDRETAVGRYKLIEEEFRKRDLPLHGHGFARKNKEPSWLKGGV